MVCPNCKSNEVVAIQGQNYCLNCGHPVSGPLAATAVEALPVEVKPADSNADIVAAMKAAAKKTKAAKASTMPNPVKPVPVVPKPVTIAHKPAVPEIASIPEVPVTELPKATKVPIGTPARVDTRPLPGSFVRHSSHPHMPHHKTKAPEAIVHHMEDATPPVSVPAVLHPTRHAHYKAPKHPLRKIMLVVSLLLIVGCIAAALALIPHLVTRIQLMILGSGVTRYTGLSTTARWSIVVGGSWLAYVLVTLVLIQSSVTSGRKHDGRPVSLKSSHKSALQTFWRVAELDLLSLPLWLGTGLLEFLLVHYATLLAPTTAATGYLIAGGSVPLGLLATWLVAGRNLGILRLSLTGDSGYAAAIFTWKAIVTEPLEVIGRTLSSLAVLLVSVLPSIILGLWLRTATITPIVTLLGSIGWVVVTTLGTYVALSYLVSSWLKMYTQLSHIHHGSPVAKKHSHKGLDASFAAALLLIVFGVVRH